ncbi:uncharacterized protein TNCV_1886731 [Trichonephila clavipes]|nr:uncharacterized protein TNCV_1886731 [Trichonephila clavipes]
MCTNEEYCEMVLLYGQYNRNKRESAKLYAIKFPVEDIHLIVQLPVLFNACIKPGVVIDVFHYLAQNLRQIPAEDVLGYVLAHPESSVRDISKACSCSKAMERVRSCQSAGGTSLRCPRKDTAVGLVLQIRGVGFTVDPHPDAVALYSGCTLDCPLTASPHKSLSSSRGVISEPDLLCTSDAEILEEFSDQDVVQPKLAFAPLNPIITSHQADLLTSSSPIAAISESEPVNPTPNNVPSTSNISAFPSNSGV